MDYIDNYLDAIYNVLGDPPLDENKIHNVGDTLAKLIKLCPDKRDYIMNRFIDICKQRGIGPNIF